MLSILKKEKVYANPHALSFPTPPPCTMSFSSVQFSPSVVFNSLQPHGLQHARPPCPSSNPGVYLSLKRRVKKLALNSTFRKLRSSGPITSWQIDGETVETVSDFNFWVPKSLQMLIAVVKLKDTYSLEGKL